MIPTHTPWLPPIRVAAPRAIVDLGRPARTHTTGVLVIGGGLAGLSAALVAAEYADVTLLARISLAESNSAWAQGGIAAALDPTDSPGAHIADTLVAGAGLSDEPAVAALASEAPGLMRELAAWGVPFERSGDLFALGLEGGHSQRRILHVGDATGAAVTQVLAERASAHPRIRVIDTLQVVDLIGGRRCEGALACTRDGAWHRYLARAVVLCTGGAGALFGVSSNPPGALGEGIAMAYRAGAEVADMEFVQFHPTIYRTPSGAGFLISEAARGEGGQLLTPRGVRFMPHYDQRGELAPRDVVTRGIYAAMRAEGSDHVLLDLTRLGRSFLEQRFPTIMARCRSEGLDPAREPIPVAPAAHYLMGGVRTDLDGATSWPGLYAAGECACTGVHGANRLASNSLLECLVFGRRAGERAAHDEGLLLAEPRDHHGEAPPSASAPPARAALSALVGACAGPLRSAAQLAEGLAQLDRQAGPAPDDAESLTCANATLTARLVVASALLRAESRGGHFRSDFPRPERHWQRHSLLRNGAPPALIAQVASDEAVTAAALS
jgi:L-aspartate oxidase